MQKLMLVLCALLSLALADCSGGDYGYLFADAGCGDDASSSVRDAQCGE